MKTGNILYEGKAKIVFEAENADLLVLYFKDDATAFNGSKKDVIGEKGIINNAISTELFKYLEFNSISTHFVRKLSEREMLVKRIEMIPVEIVVRNIVAGSLSKRIGIAEGEPLKKPLVEFYYKSDRLGDPMLNRSHVEVFDLADSAEIDVMTQYACSINKLLKSFLDERGIILVDFKLEFGRLDREIVLGDEISPDGCRLWDKKTGERMDKDRFRRNMGNVKGSYQELYRRIIQAK